MSRVVRKHEMSRFLDMLGARQIAPACFDLLPGGAVRVHLISPVTGHEADTGGDEEAVKGWDEVLK